MSLSIFTNQNAWHLIELFLWMLGAFLIGWFFWRWWYKNKCSNEIAAWRTKYDSLQNSIEDGGNRIKAKKVAAPGVATAMTANFVDGVARVDDSVKDDLTKVEGIGPKIKGLLNADSIWSFKQLSDTAVSQLEKILEEAGPRYRVHSPKTWPKQAKMADEGKWDELKVWQNNHKGGREN